MKIIDNLEEFRIYTGKTDNFHRDCGFIPTMGYLHDGHKSLINKSIEENRYTVVSIFVNPIQFGENEDFDSYPRDLERDVKILEDIGVDILFVPKKSEIFEEKPLTKVNVENLSNVMCGKSRPGHFSGVTTIVSKLFNIVKPSVAYFGEKDAQQLIIIKKMVEDLNFDIKIKSMPIVRESGGLALSSRNSYLSEADKNIASNIFRILKLAKDKITENGGRDPVIIKNFIISNLKKSKITEIDYIDIRNLKNLELTEEIDSSNCLIAVAVYVNSVRLIDNIILGEI